MKSADMKIEKEREWLALVLFLFKMNALGLQPDHLVTFIQRERRTDKSQPWDYALARAVGSWCERLMAWS